MSVSGMAACNKCAPRVADSADEQRQTVTVPVTVRDELGGREGLGARRDTRPEAADSAACQCVGRSTSEQLGVERACTLHATKQSSAAASLSDRGHAARYLLQ
jgi:hypothetical protein